MHSALSQRRNLSPGKAGGFTIVELLVTILIVSVLASVALPMTELVVRRNKEQELRRVLREIRGAIDAYKAAVVDGRIVRRADESEYPKDLTVLVNGVVDAKSPSGAKIYFLRRLPRDPLHQEIGVPPEKTWGKRSYAASPDEPKEGRDVFDVYSLSTGVGLNGVLYREW